MNPTANTGLRDRLIHTLVAAGEAGEAIEVATGLKLAKPKTKMKVEKSVLAAEDQTRRPGFE